MTDRSTEKAPRVDGSLWYLAACAFTVLAAYALRMHALGRAPLWYDEVMYGYLAEEVTRETFTGGSPLVEPAFVLMLKAWLVPGHGDIWMRCHAVLAGMAALWPAWLLGRRLAGRRGALYCLLFAATAPMLVYYSRDAKMYGWVILLVLAAVHFALRCGDADAKPRHFAAYVVSAALLCNTHFAAPLFLAPLNLLFVALFARRWLQTAAWLLSQAVVVACSVPFILMELKYMKVMAGMVFHAPLPTPRSLWVTLHNFVTAYSPAPALHAAGAVLAVLLVLAALLWSPGRRKPLFFLLLLSAGAVGMLYTLSHTLKWSLYIDRYVVGAAGTLLVVMAAGAAAVPWRPVRALVLLSWLAVCGFGLQDLYAGKLSANQRDHLGVVPTLDARSMARTISEQGQAGDAVWNVHWETEAPLRWYLPAQRHFLVDMGGRLQDNLDRICDRSFQTFYHWHPLEVEQASVNVSRVWFVMPGAGMGLDTLSRGILEWLKARGTLVACHESAPPYAPAALYLFDLRDGAESGERLTAALSLQDGQGTRDATSGDTAALSAAHSEDNTQIVLRAAHAGDGRHLLPYEAVFCDVSCPAGRFQRALAGRSAWSLQPYLANGKTRTGMLLRVHKDMATADMLNATVRCPQGEYWVYVEYTVKGRDYAIPTAALRVFVDGRPFEAPCSAPEQAGGWVWRYLGDLYQEQDGDCAIALSAYDPENRPEAYAVVSSIAFVRSAGAGVKSSEAPPQARGAILLEPRGEATESIPFPVDARCANILVQSPVDVAELLLRR